MVGATCRRGISLFALLAAAGCLAAPPDPGEEDPGPGVTSMCQGDPGRPADTGEPWSIASLPGWTQEDAVVGDMQDWFLALGVFNHVLHGSIATEPDGTITFSGADLFGPQQACVGVVAAHKLGYPIQIVLGGDFDGPAIAQAASGESRAVLIASLIDFVDTYGYDGVSIAWLEEVAADDLTALVQELSAAFAVHTPRLLLTVDVNTGVVDPSVSAGLAPWVDALNVMSYWPDWREELSLHLDAGVPPERMHLGIGLSFLDLGATDVAEKIDAARTSDLHGVESWELGALIDTDDPRLASYSSLFE